MNRPPSAATDNVADQVPEQTKRDAHSRTLRARGPNLDLRHQRHFRRTKARRATPPLRFSTRDGKCSALVGGSQGPLDESRGQASRGRRRGPSAGIRRLRRRDSAGQLRRRLGHRVGSRRLRSHRSAGRRRRRGPQGKNRYQLARLQTQRRVHARAYRRPPRRRPEGREELAADQEARPIRHHSRCLRGASALRAVRTDDRGTGRTRRRPSASSPTSWRASIFRNWAPSSSIRISR